MAFRVDGFFLNLSTPVLGLLVALASVLSVAVPSLTAAMHKPNSDVVVSFQYFENGAAHFVASNLGDRGGSVGEAFLDYGQQGWRFFLLGKGDRYIAPGASRRLSFDLPCQTGPGEAIQYAQDPDWGDRPLAKNAQLNVAVVQFDGTKSVATFPLGSLSSSMAISDRLHACLQQDMSRRTAAEPESRPAGQPK